MAASFYQTTLVFLIYQYQSLGHVRFRHYCGDGVHAVQGPPSRGWRLRKVIWKWKSRGDVSGDTILLTMIQHSVRLLKSALKLRSEYCNSKALRTYGLMQCTISNVEELSR